MGGVARESPRPKVAWWQGVGMARFVPLSVRRGRRAPFEFVDGIPDHIKVQLAEWVEPFFLSDDIFGGPRTEAIDAAIAALQWPIVQRDPSVRLHELTKYAYSDAERLLDLLDLLCACQRRLKTEQVSTSEN